MSGVGKTHLAKLLCTQKKYFHYSGDYRIGSAHLNTVILNALLQRIRQDDYLAALLDNDSISIQNKISFDNLSAMSAFLGKVGNPEQGGLELLEFAKRQALFLKAETQAMLDVPAFIQKAHAQGLDNFINDAGGSLCELDNKKVYQTLADTTQIVYIKASEKNESILIERAQTHPKPLYYQDVFFKEQLRIYLAENALIYAAQITPDAFVRWVFPRLLAHRKPKYAAIASHYGITIESQDLYQCTCADDFFTLIQEAK
jgi:hypothetical protein